MNNDELTRAVKELQVKVKNFEAHYDALMRVVSQILALMTPPLNDLLQVGSKITATYESAGVLTAEEFAELRIQYHKTARMVERAYAQAMVIGLDYRDHRH